MIIIIIFLCKCQGKTMAFIENYCIFLRPFGNMGLVIGY